MFNIKTIIKRIGVDKSIAYSSGSRVVAGLTGVLSVFFISTFLTGVEQGFYYTFGSILALQVFFELGLTGIMTQYVAHEASHLSLKENGEYEGLPLYKSRLASLIHFCTKWYTVLSVIVFIFLIIFGYVYFNRYGDNQENVDWQMPWILICIGTAIKLLQSPFNSIFMGLGYVKEMSKIGFYQQIIIPLATWIGLACGLKLYVLGIGYLLSVFIWLLYVCSAGLAKIVVFLWKVRVTDAVSYMKEVFPYQWRIALSWVSGYFIFQLFNPVLFATDGAIIAGQMGMTLTAINAIQAFSMSWINTKVPLFSRLIALKDYPQLDKVFNKTLVQMAIVCLVILVLFFLVIFFLDLTQFKLGGNVLAERFLPLLPMFLVALPMFIQLFVFAWATYLRCHKKEPFLVISIVTGVCCMVSTILFGYKYGLYGITVGYCVIQLLTMPWAYYIFKTKKIEWHNEE